MKFTNTAITVVIFIASSAGVYSQSIKWGVPTGETVIDSSGSPVSGSSYKFELGAFALDYNPDALNVGDWLTHWRVFDVLPGTTNFLNTENTVNILTNVTSGSTHPDADNTFSFAGLKAYVWIRNSDNPVPGTEWFLGRSDGWTFPGPLDMVSQIEWNLSDLGPGEIPEWGRQNAVPGPGESTFTGSLAGIQTHTFIPEPSAVMLSVVMGAGVLLRRKREV
jgi:hypothetical protein